VHCAEIIQDCLTVFRNIPDFFRMRTNCGARRECSSKLDDYCGMTTDEIQRVDAGLPITQDCWLEEVHLASVKVLYDIVVCV